MSGRAGFTRDNGQRGYGVEGALAIRRQSTRWVKGGDIRVGEKGIKVTNPQMKRRLEGEGMVLEIDLESRDAARVQARLLGAARLRMRRPSLSSIAIFC